MSSFLIMTKQKIMSTTLLPFLIPKARSFSSDNTIVFLSQRPCLKTTTRMTSYRVRIYIPAPPLSLFPHLQPTLESVEILLPPSLGFTHTMCHKTSLQCQHCGICPPSNMAHATKKCYFGKWLPAENCPEYRNTVLRYTCDGCKSERPGGGRRHGRGGGQRLGSNEIERVSCCAVM